MPKTTVETSAGSLDRDEMVVILERIAREGGDTARIQAIKALMALKDEEPVSPAGFAALDDELEPRRRRKAS